MPVRVVLNIQPAPAGRDEPLTGLSLQTGMTAPE